MSKSFSIHGITFNDATAGGYDLRYPKYNSLIDYGRVDDNKRKYLQLEPAFKFASPDASGSPYIFTLEIASGAGVFFADNGAGDPFWRHVVTGLRPSYVTARLVNPTTFELTLDVSKWPEEDYMVVLRIFCNKTGDSTFQDDDGVSITFIRPGGTDLQAPRLDHCAPRDSKLTITESFMPGRTGPIYDIYNEVKLPEGICLEPAFRVSSERPTIDATFKLWATTHRFKPRNVVDHDQVFVYSRADNGDRPRQLSRIKAPNPQEFQFSWTRTIDPATHPRMFGFYVPVEDISTAGKPVLIYRDPIIFNDPPPPGQLT